MSQRIYTRCPSCKNDTLIVNDDNHLLCTWIDCKNPTLIDNLEPLITKADDLEHCKNNWNELMKRESLLAQLARTITERDSLKAKAEALDWLDKDDNFMRIVSGPDIPLLSAITAARKESKRAPIGSPMPGGDSGDPKPD